MCKKIFKKFFCNFFFLQKNFTKKFLQKFFYLGRPKNKKNFKKFFYTNNFTKNLEKKYNFFQKIFCKKFYKCVVELELWCAAMHENWVSGSVGAVGAEWMTAQEQWSLSLFMGSMTVSQSDNGESI